MHESSFRLLLLFLLAPWLIVAVWSYPKDTQQVPAVALERQEIPVPATGTPTVSPSATTPPSTTTPTVSPSPTLTSTPAPTPTQVPDWYTVRPGDTLYGIAARVDWPLDTILLMNRIKKDDRLEVGQVLAIPSGITVSLPQSFAAFDSEVVYGTSYLDWRTDRFVEKQAGYLSRYLEGERTGAQIIDEVAATYHIGPRILLAAMEMLSGWVTGSEPSSPYPFGLQDSGRPTLSVQAAWAAKKLADGYYAQLEGRRDWVVLSNGVRARLYPGTNPGSAAVTNLLAAVVPPQQLTELLAEAAFQATYARLYGPIDGGAVLPPDGEQPYFALPWSSGEQWFFTGGPHGGFGDSQSGWAALDFAAPEPTGCQVSPYVVRAVSEGLVVESKPGEIWVDIDGDGDLRTGWVLLYMHLAGEGQVTVGTRLEVGDEVGYPSCEGGVANAAHLHLARMYDGQWMPANGPVPFQLGEWTAKATIGASYDGILRNRDGDILESCDCRIEGKNRFP